MELLSAVLLAVWLVGVIVCAWGVSQFVKNGEGDLHDRFTEAMDYTPGPIVAILTVLIVAWPATLIYSIATRRK